MPSAEMEKYMAILTQDLPPPDAKFAEHRAFYDTLSIHFPALAEVSSELVNLGGVRTLRYTPPDADPERTVLYFHGGGYCIGSERSHGMIVSQLAKSARCSVLFPLYRLAPEHRFPAAVEDCYQVWHALVDGGVNPAKVGFAGDSAGGALTVIVMQLARDKGLAVPACGVSISPWVDMAGIGTWRAGDPLRDAFLHPDELALFASTFANQTDWQNPLVSPLHGQFHDLPPLLIQVSASELLYQDAVSLADQFTKAGIPVTLQIADAGTPHVWHHMTPLVPEALASLEQAGAFLVKHTTKIS
jgi:epsilon-lactone hydrolase